MKIQLHPTLEQAQALEATLKQFTQAFNHVVAYGWQNNEKNGVKLHHATYRDLKSACPELVSDLLIQARVKATETVKSNEVIGVDLGLNRPAVTSTRHFLGRRHWKEVDRRYFRLKRRLQSKGTKSAKRHLGKLSGKQMRFHRDCDHVLSKRVVQHATPGSTIVLGNLTNVRATSKMSNGKGKKRDTKRRFHGWSFAQLYSFIRYKAQERGIQVVKIDPRHTSQTCSKCGHQARNNRRSQSLFLCRHCGYCLNADLNASYNIREKHLASLASLGTSLGSGSASSGLSQPSQGELQAPRL